MGRSRSETGQATVELALTLPVLVVVMAGLFEVGMIGLDQLRLWNAAREAARTAVVNSDSSDIRAAAERSGLEPLGITVEPDTLRRTAGRPLTVNLTYRPRGRVPLVGTVVDGLALHASVTMRIERP